MAGGGPYAIAITPDGKTAYVANSGTVTPITTATDTAGTPITAGSDPYAIAITPDGKTAYVANNGSGTVTPITTATDTAGTADPGRQPPLCHRDHPGRDHRLRHQPIFGDGDPDHDRACDEDRCRILSQSVRSGRRPVAGGRLVVR